MPLSDIMEQIPILGSVATLIPDQAMNVLGVFEVRKLWAFLFMNVITQ
jgi:UDP-xylose/UDP-N-acetylglucosamine transporter B4